MKLKVRLLNGRDFDLTPASGTTLEQFRETIREQTNIAIDRQRLIYQGRPLTNNASTLEQLGVQDGNVIHLVERPDQPPIPQQADTEESDPHHEHWGFGSQNDYPTIGVAPEDHVDHVELNQNVISYNIPVVFGRNPSDLQTFRMIVERAIRAAFPNLVDQIQVSTRLGEAGNPITGSIIIHMPGQESPVVDSPAIERVNMIREHLSYIEAFITVTENGLSTLVDAVLEGSPQLSGDADRIERETIVRWCDQIERVGAQNAAHNCNWVPDEVSFNEAGRYVQGEPRHNSNNTSDPHDPETARREAEARILGPNRGHTRYQLRHGLATDLSPIMSSIIHLNTLLAPHFFRMSRVVQHSDTFDIRNNDRLLTDSRANVLTVYLELFQRTIHRHSHALHLVSDLNIHFDDIAPRRLFPQYSQYSAERPVEGELVFDMYLENEENTTNTNQISALEGLMVPYEGRPTRSDTLASSGHPLMMRSGGGGIMVPMGMGIQISTRTPIRVSTRSPERNPQTQPGALANQPPTAPASTIQTGFPGNRPPSFAGGLGSLLSSVIQSAMSGSISGAAPVNMGSLPSQPNRLRLPVNVAMARPSTGTTRGPLPLAASIRRTPSAPQIQGRLTSSGSDSNVLNDGDSSRREQSLFHHPQHPQLLPRFPPNPNAHQHHQHLSPHNHHHRHSHNVHHHLHHHVAHYPLHLHHSHTHFSNVQNRPNTNSGIEQSMMGRLHIQQPNSTGPTPIPNETPDSLGRNSPNMTMFPGSFGSSNSNSHEAVDPYMPCSSRHVHSGRSYQHFERIMASVEERPSPSSQPTTIIGRMASETQIRRTEQSQIWAMSDTELDELVQLSLRTLRGFMEETDREHNGPFGAAFAQLLTVEHVPTTHTHIEITAEAVPLDQANDETEQDQEPRINLDVMPQHSRQILERFFTSTTNRSNETPGRILSSILDQAENFNANNLIGIINFVVSELFGMMDLISLMGGRIDSIGQHRNNIRRLIVTHFLFDNSRPTLDDLTSAAARMSVTSEAIRDLVQSGGGEVAVEALGSTWDVPDTAVRIERIAIEALLKALFDQNMSDATFATIVQATIAQYVRRMMSLGNMATGGRPRGYESLIQGYLIDNGTTLLGEQNSATINFVRDACLQHLRRLADEDGRILGVEDLKDVLVFHLSGSAPKKMRHESTLEGPSSSTATLASDVELLPVSPPQRDTTNQTAGGINDTIWRSAVPMAWIPIISSDISRMSSRLAAWPRSDAFQRMLGRNPHVPNERIVEEAFESALALVERMGDPTTENLLLSDAERQELSNTVLDIASQAVHYPDFDDERFPTLSKIKKEKEK